jgi:hypothetical protein
MDDVSRSIASEHGPIVVEWAPFRLAPGADEAALLEASDALQRRFLERQPGYLRRELLRGTDGQWADLVFWADAESVKSAMQAIDGSAECQRYFSFMLPSDPSDPTGGMLHLQRVCAYGVDPRG